MKTCMACQSTKALSEFSREPRMADGYRSQCKRCRQDYRNARRTPSLKVGMTFDRTCAYEECGRPFSFVYVTGSGRQKFCSATCRQTFFYREYAPSVRVKKYGMTADSFAALLNLQGGACAICLAPQSALTGLLHIDHDHACCARGSCGRCVRGLLCVFCNNALGGYEKTGYAPEVFRDYLARYATQAIA